MERLALAASPSARRTLADLEAFVALTDEERRGIALAPGLFRIGITPYYAALMDPAHADCPVRMQVIPLGAEERVSPGEYVDPLGEDGLSPAPSIVHRYPDRVLLPGARSLRDLLPPLQPAADGRAGRRGHLARTSSRRRSTTSGARRRIRDVLISGGDPLTLSTEKLEWLVSEVRAIEHVDIIRIGTRVPVCLPMRIDDELTAMLRKYHPLYINTHFNHPKEVTPEARAACERLADAGIPLGNQTVLLRGVNSQPRIIEELNRALLQDAGQAVLPVSGRSGAGDRSPAHAGRRRASRSWSTCAAASPGWGFRTW